MSLTEQIISVLPKNILDKSGTAFYSNRQTLKKGKYLIIGLNPGGDPNEISTTIQESFKKINDQHYNAYYEPWLPGGKVHRLQNNLRELFEYLGEDLKNICSTNLIYERTLRECDLSLPSLKPYRDALNLILQYIDPDVIVSFGKKPLAELKKYFSGSNIKSQFIPSQHGKWAIELLTVTSPAKTYKIVGLPHLSRYVIWNKTTVLSNIKSFVDCT